MLFSAGFEGGLLAPFTLLDDNDPEDAVAWHVEGGATFSGAYALVFGDPTCQTYFNGALGADCQPLDPLAGDAHRVAGRVRSPEITLGKASAPCPYVLTFRALVEGEPTWTALPASTFDQLRIWVQRSAGESEVFASALVTGTNSTGGAWRAFLADLTPFLGETVQIVFGFDSVDGSNNLHRGVRIDDVAVRSAPGAVICAGDSPCAADGLACTSDACTPYANLPGDTGLCLYTPVAAGSLCQEPCTQDSQCVGLGPCAQGHCVAGKCQADLDQACCEQTLAQTFWKWSFEQGLGDWSVIDGTSAGGVGWQVAEGLGRAGSGALYFGDPDRPCPGDPQALCPTYDANARVYGSVRSGVVTIPAGAGYRMLAFDLTLSTEWDGTSAASYQNPTGDDRLVVTVKGAGSPTEVWTSDAIGGSTWEPGPEGQVTIGTRRVAVDLSEWAGQAVQIGFRFDSVDHQNNVFFGAAIDEIALAVTCTAPCTSDAACKDFLPCTGERCAGGLCVIEQTGTCCATFADCDDGNPCTSNACQAGLCVFLPLADPQCCHEGTVSGATFGFEEGQLPAGSAVAGPSGAPAAWRVATTGEVASGSAALWFGNPATGTYESFTAQGVPTRAQGTIDLPPVSLPSGGTAVLRFDLRLDTEWAGYTPTWTPPPAELAFDRLSLYANETLIWHSHVYELAGSTCGAGACQWRTTEASLGAFRGKSVRLRFAFDTLDDANNAFGGPRVDDLAIAVTCAPKECHHSLECNDPNDPADLCTRDKCLGGTCFFEPTGALGCTTVVTLQSEGFKGSTSTVALAGQVGQVAWRVRAAADGARVIAGSRSLHYGAPGGHTYAAGDQPVKGTATWAFTAPADPGHALEWWQWLGLDPQDTAVTILDVFSVTITDTQTTQSTVVFTNKPAYNGYQSWQRRSVSLMPWVGRPLRVTFSFQSGDGVNNAGEGIYLDDLRVGTPTN